MRAPMRACDPVKITMLDGKERSFLLTRGALKRLRAEVGAATNKDLMALDLEGMVYPLFRHSFQPTQNETALTDEMLDDLLPADTEWSFQAIGLIFGASQPDPDPNQPAPGQASQPEQ